MSAVRFVLVPVSLIEQVERREISRDAAWLNVVMLSHVNRKRGDSEIWHTRETLAPEMGVSKASNIDKYVKGLEAAGNIKVERRKVGKHRNKNRYTVLNVVPSSIVPMLGPSVVPESGSSLVPELGPELYEGKPHESKLDESSCAPSSSSSVAEPRSDRKDEEDDQREGSKPARKPARTVKQRQQQRRDDASKEVLEETQAIDDLDVKALAAFYEQDERYLADDGMLYLAGVIEKDGIDKAAEHLDKARDMFGGWIADQRKERDIAHRRKEIGDWFTRVHPKMRNLEQVLDAFVSARRDGVADQDLTDGINVVHDGKNNVSFRAYLNAIESVRGRSLAA